MSKGRYCFLLQFNFRNLAFERGESSFGIPISMCEVELNEQLKYLGKSGFPLEPLKESITLGWILICPWEERKKISGSTYKYICECIFFSCLSSCFYYFLRRDNWVVEYLTCNILDFGWKGREGEKEVQLAKLWNFILGCLKFRKVLIWEQEANTGEKKKKNGREKMDTFLFSSLPT